MGTTCTMLEAAVEYHHRGWSIIPMKMDTKLPAFRWKRYQIAQVTERTLKKWFANGEYGLGVIFGDVSGGLISRDFDTMESYNRWASDHTDLAEILPTVATRRGLHVYARATSQHIAEVRQFIGKPDCTGAILVADGELRCGVGCYCMLPPTLHPLGAVYRWEVPLPDGLLPEIDVFKSKFYEAPSPSKPCNREHRVDGDYGGLQRLQKNTEAISKGLQKNNNTKDAIWSDAIHEAIIDSIPEGPGQRHRQVFELARGLKAVPELSDAEAGALRPYVEEWHKLSLANITTKPFEETWIDFLKAWPNVKYPKGADPMTAIFEQATLQPVPEEAKKYEQDALKLLVVLCRELQRSAGDGPFYLSCRTAGRLLGVDHTTANRWLFLMANDGILEIVDPGDRAKRKAARYRYLEEL